MSVASGSSVKERAWIAALRMYDFPETETANDAFWALIASQCWEVGIQAPDALERGLSAEDVWHHADLLVAQTCGYPLVFELAQSVQVLGTPCYHVDGCTGGRYSSAIIVGAADNAESLAELRGTTAAVNCLNSQSGCNALRASLVDAGAEGVFVSDIVLTGAHIETARRVRDGTARFGAIDAVTWALLMKIAPDLTRNLRVLKWTASAPSLPLVTHGSHSASMVDALRAVVEHAAAAHYHSGQHADLCPIEGFQVTDINDYSEIRDMKQKASLLDDWAPIVRASET